MRRAGPDANLDSFLATEKRDETVEIEGVREDDHLRRSPSGQLREHADPERGHRRTEAEHADGRLADHVEKQGTVGKRTDQLLGFHRCARAVPCRAVQNGWRFRFGRPGEVGTFADKIHRGATLDLCVIVPKRIEDFPEPNERLSGYIDVWWILQDGGLLILLSFLLNQHKVRLCYPFCPENDC